MSTRVASLDPWLESVAGRLIDGEKLLLQSLPGLGKTFICKRLSAILGPSAIAIQGRQIADAGAKDTAKEISDNIALTVEREGCAQLLFDDYSRALTSVLGQQLQAMLHGLLVNSLESDAIGALVTSRLGEKLHVPKAGSPLLSRLDYLAEPRWSDTDIPTGKGAESLEREIGPTVGILALALGSDGFYDPQRVTRHLDLNADLIVSGCGPSALQFLAGRRALADLMPTDREQLSGLLSRTGLTSAARGSQLQQIAMSRSQGWPTGLHDSATAFAALVEGQQHAMWVDRFLFKRPAALRLFLIEVRKMTSTHLRLLGGNPPREPIDRGAIRGLTGEVNGVESRILTAVQYRKCHDRHMVFPDNSGNVLPIAEVVMGVGEPGTAVITHAPAFPSSYGRYWRDALQM